MDDLISKGQLFRRLSNVSGNEFTRMKIIAIIDNTPIVEKTGQWVIDGDPDDQYLKCSKCGEHGIDQYRPFGWATIKSHYCPNCGSKMI